MPALVGYNSVAASVFLERKSPSISLPSLELSLLLLPIGVLSSIAHVYWLFLFSLADVL